MPGVRYGPDISDDAAYFVDKVKEIQANIRLGKKPNAGERTTLANAAELANKVFGVSKANFDKGKLGEMAEMARYGGSKALSRRAKDSRDGSSMTKSVAEELLDRSTGRNSRGSRTKPAEGTYYEGRTRSKRFRELEAKATKRLNRNGVEIGKRSIKKGGINSSNFKDRVDGLQITKARGGKKDTARGAASSDLMNRVRGDSAVTKPGIGIRPRLARSQQRAEQRKKKVSGPKTPASATRAKGGQAKTKTTVQRAGKNK
jgi:hypothetical protein